MRIIYLISLICCGFAAACSTSEQEFPREEILKPELIVSYLLDFAVDEETFTLYGAGEDGIPEDHLLVYKLKGLY